MKIEKIKIATLTPDPKNARVHNKKNIEAIASSLREFGQRTPIVLQRRPEGELIVRKGNGTVEAAKSLGWKEIEALVFEEDDVKAQAYAIADNRTGELAEWDETILAELLDDLASEYDVNDLGFDINEFSELMSLLEEPELEIGLEQKSSTPGALPVLPEPSHVRMVQLFLNSDNIDEFLDCIETIKARYGYENVTEAVFGVCKLEAERGEANTPDA